MIVLKEPPKKPMFTGKLVDGTDIKMYEKPYGSETFLFHDAYIKHKDKWVPVQVMKTSILYITRNRV